MNTTLMSFREYVILSRLQIELRKSREAAMELSGAMGEICDVWLGFGEYLYFASFSTWSCVLPRIKAWSRQTVTQVPRVAPLQYISIDVGPTFAELLTDVPYF
jgi:hypothetical protein